MTVVDDKNLTLIVFFLVSLHHQRRTHIFKALRNWSRCLHLASKIGGTLLWRITADTFETLRIGIGTVPSNLFEVCIAIIVSYNVNYTSVLRPTMRQYDPTAIGYPLRRCTLVLKQGRRLALLSFLTSLTRPLSVPIPRSSCATDASLRYALLHPLFKVPV